MDAKTKKAIAKVRRELEVFNGGFSFVVQRRASIAPKFGKLFAELMAEGVVKNFVEFTRLLDPSIPMDRDGYRNHPSFQAADYLRRLWFRAGRFNKGQ